MGRAFVIVIVLGAIALAVLHFRGRGREEESPVPMDPGSEAAPEPSLSEKPALPPAPRAPSRPEPAEPEAALPDLDASDATVTRMLVDRIGQRAFERFVVGDDMVRKAVATTDNLTRGALPMRVRVVRPLGGRFETTVDGDEIHLSPKNYVRYEDFVRSVQSLDAAAVAETYARLYPLLQRAFEELGHPGQQFNDRVIAAVDDLLRAPEPEPPIRLKPARAFSYAFEDPALESLNPGAKAMIRMGPENAAIVKAKLREIRSELVSRSRSPGAGAGPG